ncbi:PD40 domain-containing protein [Aquimarina sp. MMG016]|nr:PD40 domain-containing protein [Aquimarina sp. MMG016]
MLSAQIDESLKYLGEEPPSLIPKVFAPDMISKPGESEFGSVFSKDGTEFFYGVDINGRAETRYTRLEKDSWTTPKTIISHKSYGHNDPFLSPDEYRLYYISDRPLNGKGSNKDHDIWYSEKRPYGWSKPINAGVNINSDRNEYYMSFTNDGTMYFSSNVAAEKNNNSDFDIYTSKFIDGEFQKPKKLSDAVNTKAYEADVFVAPDESYIIFCATRKNGLGRGDLYISFKNADGTWTPSKNMDEPINSKNHELCPFVTKDGKYLFYTSNQDIYWVDAKIIQQYRSP